jgi:hypothetical protein
MSPLSHIRVIKEVLCKGKTTPMLRLSENDARLRCGEALRKDGGGRLVEATEQQQSNCRRITSG